MPKRPGDNEVLSPERDAKARAALEEYRDKERGRSRQRRKEALLGLLLAVMMVSWSLAFAAAWERGELAGAMLAAVIYFALLFIVAWLYLHTMNRRSWERLVDLSEEGSERSRVQLMLVTVGMTIAFATFLTIFVGMYTVTNNFGLAHDWKAIAWIIGVLFAFGCAAAVWVVWRRLFRQSLADD
jgi:cation transport ATPase